MKVLHIAASLSPDWGGPANVTLELSEALGKKGVAVTIFAISKGEYIEEIKGVTIRTFPESSLSNLWTSYSPRLSRALKKEIFNFDLIHIHELWHYPHYAGYKAAKNANRPFIVSIHGGLEPWCLKHKAFKKRIYSIFIQKKILKEASGIHVNTQREIKNILNFVENKNIFVVPNGIKLEEFRILPNKEIVENLYPEIKNKKIILFLGRIHPIKGLDILAKAFSKVLEKKRDIQLMIAGPGNSSYKLQIVKILKEENALNNTTFTGMLMGDIKLAALNKADIFILPSYSEGFSIAILEAMASRIPVIITKNCNFDEVEKIEAGKVINANVNELSNAIIELLDNPELCRKMGDRGKIFVDEQYSWDKIADMMINEYEKIIKKSALGKK